MSQKNDDIYVNHMLENISACEEFSKGLSKEALATDRLRQSAIIREIEVIGEAAKNISEEVKRKHSSIAWKEIIRTRDKMIHHYFGVDPSIVWSIVKNDLPQLKKDLENIKRELTRKEAA